MKIIGKACEWTKENPMMGLGIAAGLGAAALHFGEKVYNHFTSDDDEVDDDEDDEDDEDEAPKKSKKSKKNEDDDDEGE